MPTGSHSFSLAEHLSGVVLLELPLEKVCPFFRDSLKRFGPVCETSFNSWEQVKEFLLPLKSFPKRYVAVSLGNWTLLIVDMRYELCSAEAMFIGEKAGCQSIEVSSLEESRLFKVMEKGRGIRAISCYRDEGKWIFYQEGKPFKFEQVDNYVKPKGMRLTPDMVAEYVHSLTGLRMPLVWKDVVKVAVGMERSTHELKNPLVCFETIVDI